MVKILKNGENSEKCKGGYENTCKSTVLDKLLRRLEKNYRQKKYFHMGQEQANFDAKNVQVPVGHGGVGVTEAEKVV